jgi:hypothetical protein
MSPQQKAFRRLKSIAGAALFVVGMFILYKNKAGAVTHLSHVVAKGSDALGVLPATVLAISLSLRAYGFDHQRIFCGLFHQIFLSAGPLLLVIFGTVLSRENFADQSNIHPEPVRPSSAGLRNQ